LVGTILTRKQFVGEIDIIVFGINVDI